jgi:hypothetical protein
MMRLYVAILLTALPAMAAEPVLPMVESPPPGLGNRKLAEIGAVDVTAPPFRADPNGKIDSTRVLQEAIEFARDHRMIVFFPAGTYLVSDTLQAVRGPASRRVFGGSRMLPCLLMGDRRSSRRARILLAPRSPGLAIPTTLSPLSICGLHPETTPPIRNPT